MKITSYEKIASEIGILERLDFSGLSSKDRVDFFNMLSDLAYKMVDIKHPILNVKLIPASEVKDNNYNPNKMASPEFRLLKHSIKGDGMTMPIVVSKNNENESVIVDGFHRTKIIKNNMDIKNSLCSYIPVVNLDRTENERISSSVRHNMARGSHQVELTSKLVMKLKQSTWDNSRICSELGMDADEVLRMQQITGLADAFKNNSFSKSWE